MSSKKTVPDLTGDSPVSINSGSAEVAMVEPARKKTNGNGKVKNKTTGPTNFYDAELDRRELLRVLSEVKNGNFSVRMPIDLIGIDGKICDTLNDIIYINEKLMAELTIAGKTIGKQGKLNHRVDLPYAKGTWNTGVDSI